MDERRSHERSVLCLDAHVAVGPETPLPAARTIDVSPAGILLAFEEPIGIPVGSRVVLSLDLADGRFHALGIVRRIDRGADFRTYVAATFEELEREDYQRLVRQFHAHELGHN